MEENKYIPSPEEIAKINEQRKSKVVGAEIEAAHESYDPYRALEVAKELKNKSVDEIIPTQEAVGVMIDEAKQDDLRREIDKAIEVKRKQLDEIGGGDYQNFLEGMPDNERERFKRGRSAAVAFAKIVFRANEQAEGDQKKHRLVKKSFSLEELDRFISENYPELSLWDIMIHLDCFVSGSSDFDSELNGMVGADEVVNEIKKEAKLIEQLTPIFDQLPVDSEKSYFYSKKFLETLLTWGKGRKSPLRADDFNKLYFKWRAEDIFGWVKKENDGYASGVGFNDLPNDLRQKYITIAKEAMEVIKAAY